MIVIEVFFLFIYIFIWINKNVRTLVKPLKEKLRNYIEKSIKTINTEAYKETGLSKISKEEMNSYKASSTLGINLAKTDKKFMMIPPTPKQPERAFFFIFVQQFKKYAFGCDFGCVCNS